MPTHTPHFPDLLFEDTARLRRWESLLMEAFEQAGFRELQPSLILREATEADAVRFFDGEELVALRRDFTEGIARMLVRRFASPPPRLSYAGPVFRRPVQAWEPVERFEVGCERIHEDPLQSGEADAELAALMMAVPARLGLGTCVLHLGHAAMLRRPLEIEGLPTELAARVVLDLDRRALHRVAETLAGHPARTRLMIHAEMLLAGPDGLASLQAMEASPYAGLLERELAHLREVYRAHAQRLPEGLSLRIDLADVRGLNYYTGPTLRLWAQGAQQELASGGRYDRLYPELGKPWFAAGFCVRLTRLLDLGIQRPDLFRSTGAKA